jgi:hypothetical protein
MNVTCHFSDLSILVVTVVVAATPVGNSLQAQERPVSPWCSAAFCEEGAIYVAAIDSMLGRTGPPCTEQPPRVLSTIHIAPFRRLDGEVSPPIALYTDTDPGMLRRRWPDAQVVDSAAVVDSTGRYLVPGGCLYVLSPIDWLSRDIVRLQLAQYTKTIDLGAQYFILLERGREGWGVVRIDVGRQN